MMADFFNQQCAQNISLANPQYERMRSVNIWNIKEGDQIKFDFIKKAMKGFTFVDCYDYILFLPSQFDWITEGHIDALNKDTNKSFIIKKRVRGVLDIEWKGEKPNDNEDTEKKINKAKKSIGEKKKIADIPEVSESEESDTVTVGSKENKKVSKKANK